MPKIVAFDGKEVEYVEVHDEPIHRRQFSNDYVYIYIAGIRQVLRNASGACTRSSPTLLLPLSAE